VKADPQVIADQIQKEVADIRGLPFKRPVKASQQTPAQFGAYLDKELSESSSINLDKNYGKVIRALGLYRGPEIQDARALIKMVESSQAAAYYDPDKQTFYVLMGNMPDLLAASCIRTSCITAGRISTSISISTSVRGSIRPRSMLTKRWRGRRSSKGRRPM